MTDSQPDAAFFILKPDPSPWSLPWVAKPDVTPTEGGRAGKRLVRVWFRREANDAVISSLAPSAPDRPHDLKAYNHGQAPPTVFWHIHPRVEAYDGDDGSNWWARLWRKTV